MGKKRREEMILYINDKGRITANKLCKSCAHSCKQSFRAVVIRCPNWKNRRSA